MIATFAGLAPGPAVALERELVTLFAAEAKGAGASQRASASEERTVPVSRPSDADDTGPAGEPCYELEYLMVHARRR